MCNLAAFSSSCWQDAQTKVRDYAGMCSAQILFDGATCVVQ